MAPRNPRNSGSILPLHDRTLRSGRPSTNSRPGRPSTNSNNGRPSTNSFTTYSQPKGRLSRKPNHKHHITPHNIRHPRFTWIPNRVRNEGIAFIAELCGTFMFMFIAFGCTQVANAAASIAGDNTSSEGSLSQAPDAATLQYISLAFGFSLAINVWIFYRISGGLFNPVVSLALYLVGAIKATRAILCVIAQIIGGIFAAAVVDWILPGPLNVSTALSATTSIAQGLFLEMFMTTELVLAILFLAAEKQKSTYLAPIGIGLALFVAELMGVYFTGGSLNPARSFGPAVISGFKGYHWIYWLGPAMGSLLAVGFYKLMKYGEYETVNPGQDFNEQETEFFHPPDDPVSADQVARPDPVAFAAQEAVREEMSPERSRGRSLAAMRSGDRNRDTVDDDDDVDIEAGAEDERRRKENGAEVIM